MNEDKSKLDLGQALIERGLISPRDLDRAVLAKREMGGLLGDVLIRLGLVAELDLARVLCTVLDVSLAEKKDYPIQSIAIAGLPESFLFNHRVVPISISECSAVFASVIPQDPYVKKALGLALGKEIEVRLGLAADIDAAFELRNQSEEDELEANYSALDVDDAEFVEHLKDLASEAPVIQRVNQIIQYSLDLGASDIHLESFDGGLRLRYRTDGVLKDSSQKLDASFAAAIISRIKLLANLNIAERRLPQDGRIMIRVKGHELDLRVSTLPTVHGEGVVLRVLDRNSILLELSEMGFSKAILQQYKSLLSRPHGVLLLTGPTGSGKTTTLYASLANMDAESLKIITVEDPVEYQLKAINQIPIQPQIGLTFAQALRSILRQDPDIIMVGEMRDTETAQIAVQSALTGHLVLSTLHTNTAAGALTRLEDMGVERFLITAAVNGVLAQRLIRKLCEKCKRRAPVTREFLIESGLIEFMESPGDPIYESVGCNECKQTGYLGRMAIHELFVLDPIKQRLVLDGADAVQLHDQARESGMKTLYEDGLQKVVAGFSSLDEVLRVTQDQNHEIKGTSDVA